MSITVDLEGQVAWITGGASGIGAAIVETLAAAGARVVSLDQSYSADPQPSQDGILRVSLDVRDSSDVEATTLSLLGKELAPQILVNNAGITRDGVVWKLSDDEWSEVIEVNLSGMFRMTRAAATAMRAAGKGAIVNIASINALRGKFGQSNYAASKGGVIAFTKAVARELARDHVRVNAVAPGFIETPMTARLPRKLLDQALGETLLGAFGRPQDVANAVLFLVSPLASHITGHVLVVDGGQMI